MTDINTWSPVDASNNQPPPDGWPEGMAPSGVNNSARAVMGAVRRFYDQTVDGSLALPYLKLNGGGTVTGNVTINLGTLTANGDLNVGSNAHVTGTLTGTALAALGDLTVGNNANVAGTLTAGALSAPYTTTTVDLTVGNNAAVTGTVTAGSLTTPYANVSTALTVGPNLTAGNISVTGNASVAGTLTAGLYKGTSTVNIYENVNHTFRGNDLSNFAIFNSAGTYNWSGSWLTLSDAALKQDVRDYERGLAAVQLLRPVAFRYSGGPFAGAETRYGLIAQEVAAVVPEMVGEAEFGDGPVLTTQPGHLIWLLVRSCQELAARVEALEGGAR